MILALAAVVQIGVLGLFHPQRLIIKAPEAAVLRIQSEGHEWILPPGRSAVLIRQGSSMDLFVRSVLTEVRSVRVSSRAGGPVDFRLEIESKIERAYHGVLTASSDGGELVPIVEIDREMAVAAAVAAEYPAATAMEAMKAMAVLTRSYYAASARRHRSFEYCDTTHCQFHRSPPAPKHPARAVAEATRGEVIEYHGTVFAPLYFGSCDGRTRAATDVEFSPEPYPYFPVSCPHPFTEWSAPADERLDGSEAARLRGNRDRGSWAVKSNSYRVEGETVRGKGEGHLVGLCQKGAALMRGTYREILRQYYPNTSLVRR